MTLPDLVGLVGVVLIAAAYVALQAQRIDPAEWIFSAVNAAGALLVLVSLAYEFNLAAALVESFWLLTSLWGLARAAGRRNASQPDRPARQPGKHARQPGKHVRQPGKHARSNPSPRDGS